MIAPDNASVFGRAEMSGVTSTEHYYDLLAHGREPRTLTAGEVVFEQGDSGESLFVVRSGSVELRDGEHVVETVEAPGLFGEMALIEDSPRSLTAAAAGGVSLIEIPARHFWVLVHDTPYFAQLVMSVMAQRLRRQSATV
jgi:CRP-like cAMP-binding protein